MCIICVHQCFCVWSVSCYLNLTETILCAVSYILTGPSVYRNSFQLQMKQKEQSPYSGLLNRCFVWMCVSLELWLHACEYSLQSWLFSHFTIHFFSIQVQYTSLFMEFCCTGSFIDVIHLLYYLYQASNGWWLQKITRHNWAPF